MTWNPRQPPDKDVDREIQDHLDLEAEERAREGLSADQAARAARLAFGNPALVNEDVRAAWGWGRVEEIVLDVSGRGSPVSSLQSPVSSLRSPVSGLQSPVSIAQSPVPVDAPRAPVQGNLRVVH